MNHKAAHSDDIDAYLSGAMTAEARTAFEAACRQDAALAEALALRRMEFEVAEALIAQDIRAQMSALRAQEPPPDDTPKPGGGSRLRWIALIVLAGLVALFFWLNDRLPANEGPVSPQPAVPPSQHFPVDTPRTTAPPDQAANPPVQQAPSGRLQAMRLYQRPDMGLLRGNDAGNDPLAAAVTAWDSSDYARVMAFCKTLPADNPSYWRAQYMHAHAAFNLKQFNTAGRLFATISAAKVMPWSEESDWYYLLSLLAADQRNSPAFEQQRRKIEQDAGHPYHKALRKFK